MAKATILIVEDSLDISEALADALQFANFSVLQAYSGLQGLQIASERHPDLILMDIQLPDLDGLAAAETLKSDPAVAGIPIVVMTAHELEGDQVRAMSRTCVAYLQKPVPPRQLISLITAILKLPADDDAATRKRPAKKPQG